MLTKNGQITNFLRYFESEIRQKYDTRIVILTRFSLRESVLCFYARITILIGRIVILTKFYSRESVFYLRENHDSGLENRDSHAFLCARICFIFTRESRFLSGESWFSRDFLRENQFFYLHESHDSGRDNRDSHAIFFARINFLFTRESRFWSVFSIWILCPERLRIA